MGRRIRERDRSRSQTLPSSPSHSFSSSWSSDFEFTISLSPRKASSTLCSADELFYKGQLLPLHLSPRISMVRTLLSASSSKSSSYTTASRDSASSNDSNSSFTSDLAFLAPDCHSSRPSSVAEDDEFKRLKNSGNRFNSQIKRSKYFSLARFSSVFKKDPKNSDPNDSMSGSSVKRMSATAKELITKYLKKVKPLYEKLSQKQQKMEGTTDSMSAAVNRVCLSMKLERSYKDRNPSLNNQRKETSSSVFSYSFSGNLRYPRRRSCVSSCPSSMRSSPSHSGVLCRTGYSGTGTGPVASTYRADLSSMEELQSAIQGAIAHCKNSMTNKNMVSNEI